MKLETVNLHWLNPEMGADSPSVSSSYSAHWPQPTTFHITFLFKYYKSIYIMMENIQASSSRSGTREPEYRKLFCYTRSCNMQITWNSGAVYNNVLYCMQLNHLKGMNLRIQLRNCFSIMFKIKRRDWCKERKLWNPSEEHCIGHWSWKTKFRWL